MNAKVIAVTNQKGGVAKTTTVFTLGVALAREGFKVLLVDLDPQQSLTCSFGVFDTDELEYTIADLMKAVMYGNDEPDYERATLLHPEGVRLLPANYTLFEIDPMLNNVLSRETVAKRVIDGLRQQYDYILIDCMPSLGVLTINAWTAADTVVIPVTPDYLSAKALNLLLRSIRQVKRQLNPGLGIDGILMTIVEDYTSDAKSVMNALRKSSEGGVRVFNSYIPKSIKLKQAVRRGGSVFAVFHNSRPARAYDEFTMEFLGKLTEAQKSDRKDADERTEEEKLQDGEKNLLQLTKDELIGFVTRRTEFRERDLNQKTKAEIMDLARVRMEQYAEEVIQYAARF